MNEIVENIRPKISQMSRRAMNLSKSRRKLLKYKEKQLKINNTFNSKWKINLKNSGQFKTLTVNTSQNIAFFHPSQEENSNDFILLGSRFTYKCFSRL